MNKKTEKAFTIVELVIVIAVIAILAGVITAVFSNVVKRANESADMQLIRNLNTALATDAVINGKHDTMQSALDAVEKDGYTIESINASASENRIAWDSKNDVFCYLKEDGTPEYVPETDVNEVNDVDFFVMSTEIDEKYSTYLLENNGVTEYTALKGLDVGKNTGITKITYNRSESDPAQSVIIRTNDYITDIDINAQNDTVYHYGKAGKVDITSVANESYHENGKTVYLKVAQGHIVFEPTAEVDILYCAVSTGVKFDLIPGAEVKHAHASESKVRTAVANLSSKDIAWDYTSTTYVNHPTSSTWNADTAANTIIAQKIAAENFENAENDGNFVARIGETGYTEFAEAWTKAKAGETIVLLQDVTESIGYSLYKTKANGYTNNTASNITLDLNGKTYTYTGTGSTYAFAINNSKTLYIVNSNVATGTITSSAGVVNIASGYFYFNNSEYNNRIKVTSAGKLIDSSGTSYIYVTNCDMTSNETPSETATTNGAMYITGVSTVSIKKSTINSETYAINASSCSKNVTLTDDKISSSGESAIYFKGAKDSYGVSLTNCTVNVSGDKPIYVDAENIGKITVNNVTLYSSTGDSPIIYFAEGAAANTPITLSGGTFTDSSFSFGDDSKRIKTLTISSGTVNLASWESIETLTLTNGTTNLTSFASISNVKTLTIYYSRFALTEWSSLANLTTLTISGGTVYLTDLSSLTKSTLKTLKITGGKVYFTTWSDLESIKTLTISGGTIYSIDFKALESLTSKPTITITSGTFSKVDPTAYVDTTKYNVTKSGSNYVVK